jgi:hypothetical protein
MSVLREAVAKVQSGASLSVEEAQQVFTTVLSV